MLNIFKKKSLELYSEVERPLCPFYGFNGMHGSLMDSKGNQCALITDSFSPCQMEMAEDNPNWHECGFNTEEHRKGLEEVAERVQVFPREFHPPTAKSWAGISLKNWMNYILNKK